MVLPEIINLVVNEEDSVSVPRDTVVQELKNVAALYTGQTEDLAMAMAVYMLGFNTYIGFSDKIEHQFGKRNTEMLKRIYEYAKKYK
jgi:hypothetical protein